MSTFAAVQILLVLGCLEVAFAPVVPADGGGGGDESGEHLGVLLLDVPELDGAVEGGVGLEVAQEGEFAVGAAEAGLLLRDPHDAAHHALVVLLHYPPLQHAEGPR